MGIDFSVIPHIVDRAREYNHMIGEYDFNEKPISNYENLTISSVKLDNGAIDIPIKAMQYHEPQEIPIGMIQSIAKTFRPF